MVPKSNEFFNFSVHDWKEEQQFMTSLAPLFSLNCLLRGSGINEKCKKV